MRFACALTAVLFALPALAAETPPLPADVAAYLARDRQTPACQPKNTAGLSTEQLVYNLMIARWSPACADLERERMALLGRYKDNKAAVDALTLKIAFVGEAL
jgi:hypothetical protein